MSLFDRGICTGWVNAEQRWGKRERYVSFSLAVVVKVIIIHCQRSYAVLVGHVFDINTWPQYLSGIFMLLDV